MPVAREVIDVRHRPALTRRFSTLPGRDFEAILRILSSTKIVEIDEGSFPGVCRDPKDDKFLASAAAANAQSIVSVDNDLLVLGSYEGIDIVDAATFLSLKKW